MVLNGIFLKNQKMFPGDKIPKMTLSWKKWHLLHLLGAKCGKLWLINQLIPILSTKNGAKWDFPQNPKKCFLGTKCQKWYYLEKNCVWLIS
jgi:hypothetical protein